MNPSHQELVKEARQFGGSLEYTDVISKARQDKQDGKFKRGIVRDEYLLGPYHAAWRLVPAMRLDRRQHKSKLAYRCLAALIEACDYDEEEISVMSTKIYSAPRIYPQLNNEGKVFRYILRTGSYDERKIVKQGIHVLKELSWHPSWWTHLRPEFIDLETAKEIVPSSYWQIGYQRRDLEWREWNVFNIKLSDDISILAQAKIREDLLGLVSPKELKKLQAYINVIEA